MSGLPYREIPRSLPQGMVTDGLEVFLRVTPKASANRLQGLIDDGTGRQRIKVQVTAVPEAGKANAAVIKLLSRVWKIPKSDLAVVSGQTDRNKTVQVSGDSTQFEAIVAAISSL